MARTGPITTDPSTIVLGLAQIRVGVSATYIGNQHDMLVAAGSIGALGITRFIGNVDWFRLESGYPLVEDYTIPIRESAALECSFKQITPINMGMAFGNDPNASPYSAYTVHSGEVPLGARGEPDFIRMEAVYTYPNGTNLMYIIAPRAQVINNVEMDLAAEDAVAVACTFEFKNADSNISGGSSIWDNKSLGRIYWE